MPESSTFNLYVRQGSLRSSKTACGLAFQLSKRRSQSKATYGILGLTSASNVPWLERQGFYDRVVDYEALDSLRGAGPALLVDFSGNAMMLERLRATLGSQLRYISRVGAVHRQERERGPVRFQDREGFFFAPGEAKARSLAWGADGFRTRLADCWREFSESAGSWMEISRSRGATAVGQVYQDLLRGKSKPNKGHVLSLYE